MVATVLVNTRKIAIIRVTVVAMKTVRENLCMVAKKVVIEGLSAATNVVG